MWLRSRYLGKKQCFRPPSEMNFAMMSKVRFVKTLVQYKANLKDEQQESTCPTQF